MLTALHYTPVKNPAETGKIFGLQIAVLDWLKAFFRYGAQDKFHLLVGDAAGQKEIEETAAAAGLDSKRLIMLDQRRPRENFGQFDVVFRADPDTKKLLWQRQQVSPPGFAFCGLAHAISGIEGGTVLEQYCLAPSNAADAIVCPSRAVAGAIRSFWDNYSDYLRARFGTDFQCPVQLPVIPLGIDVEKFAARVTPEKRKIQRAQLGFGENDIALLWVGRLSHAIKAHPLAMFRAAERAAEWTGASVHLVMQGYFVPKEAAAQFENLARDVCKKAKVTFVTSDDARFPDGLWASGDIFLSLVDNAQESFGLTPIEAMAAGLPRVMSDWDGYRDSVENGEDGFLIRTLMPPPGAGQDLAELLLNGREMYGGFLGKTALCTAVDIEMAAAAIKILIEDKEKRKTMAEKARTRAGKIYDWRHIIPAYEALWKEMAARRQGARGNPAWPLVPDPFAMYAGYPSAALKETDRLHAMASAETIHMLLGHDINIFGLDMMIAPDDLAKLINRISAQAGIAIGDVFKEYATLDQSRLWRTLGWLIKLGILRMA
jgi:glycosyltransferase involved in cell wall biosynthesis